MMNQIEKASHTLEDKISKRTHALRAEKQKAETANEAKTEFLRNMSHEFRTPLHAMNSFSIYGLNEAHEADREKLHRYFSRIHRGTKRLLALVDEILTMARLESGKEHFNFTPHDIKLLLESVIEDAQSLCNDKHIDITLTLENSENSSFSTQLVCDGPRIVQVLTNILGNAIRFSPEKGSIIWEMTLTDINNTPHLQMACHDEGVGIPEDELHSIFDKFVQSSRTNTGAGGTGLGLAIARHIIISHQGTITASNSSSLKGACFTLTLPCDLQRQTKEVHSIVS
jgi:signal transduction histidine kinase